MNIVNTQFVETCLLSASLRQFWNKNQGLVLVTIHESVPKDQWNNCIDQLQNYRDYFENAEWVVVIVKLHNQSYYYDPEWISKNSNATHIMGHVHITNEDQPTRYQDIVNQNQFIPFVSVPYLHFSKN
jgi:hypothetical protein